MWLLLYCRERGHQDIVMVLQRARRGRQEATRQGATQETRQEARLEVTRQGARQEVRGAGGVAELNVAMQRGLNLGAAAYEVLSYTFLASTKNIF